MADFEITSPEGKKFVVTAPDGATHDQVLSYAQEQFKAPTASPTPPDPRQAAIDRLRAAPWGSGVDASYKEAGGIATDIATKAGLPPSIAAGVGVLGNMGAQAIPMALGGAIGKEAAPLFDAAGKRVMQSALKPSKPDMLNGKGPRAIQTMLDEGLNVTKGGAEELQGMIDKLGGQVTSVLQKYSGTTVDKGAVASRIQDVVSKIERTNPTPRAAFDDVNNVYNEFMGNGLIPKNIPVQQANELKSGIYKILRDKSYGVGAVVTDGDKALKSLGRGFKEELNAAVPEIGALTSKQGELINAHKMTAGRTAVESNSNIGGLAPLAGGANAAIAFLLDKYGLSKSVLARVLYSGQERIPQLGGAAIGGVLSQVNEKD